MGSASRERSCPPSRTPAGRTPHRTSGHQAASTPSSHGTRDSGSHRASAASPGSPGTPRRSGTTPEHQRMSRDTRPRPSETHGTHPESTALRWRTHITQSPADLPAQRRPHLRAHQHHRNRAPDLRTDRNRDTQRARRYRVAPRPAAREPLSETHRTQRARRLPRTRPHLHTRRHRTRPPHPDSTPCPRATPDHTTLARATASTANPFLARKMGLAVTKIPR